MAPKPSNTKQALNALISDIERCTLCAGSLPMGPNPVLRASTTAKILIAGQAPGIRVHQSNIPFNDPSGDRLRQWMNVDADTFYDTRQIAIVPMGFCFPGSADRGDLPPRKECSKTWHGRLLPLLEGVELTLAIGSYAQQHYLGRDREKSLTATVSNWRQYGPAVIPLPHPSPRNNIWLKRNPWFEAELVPELRKRIAKLLALG